MTDISSKCDAYFASLQPLTRKFAKEVKNLKKTYGNEWDTFTPEKQEELLDKHFIDAKISQKYQGSSKEKPQTFPTYRIQNGEKIVVDFEDGCLTWRDEHSGPFSWRTRSQQDITLDNLDEEEDKRCRSKYSRSPEKDAPGSAGTRSDRPVWENKPYLTAEQEKNGTEEEIFRKFGITFSSTNDNDEVDGELKCGGGEEVPTSTDNIGAPEISRNGYKNYAFNDNVLDTSSDSSDHVGVIKNKSEHKKKKSKKDKSETEQLLIPEASSPAKSVMIPEDAGQTSPVFINDQGESSTDPPSKFDFMSDVITLQPKSNSVLESPLNDWKISSEDNSKSTSDGVTPSTGFDFLDNW